jgi:UV DNA damage endonuclease
LAVLGQTANQQGLRLSIHPGAHTGLNSPHAETARRASAELEAQAHLLDSMGLGPEAVIVAHVGGGYGARMPLCNALSNAMASYPRPRASV